MSRRVEVFGVPVGAVVRLRRVCFTDRTERGEVVCLPEELASIVAWTQTLLGPIEGATLPVDGSPRRPFRPDQLIIARALAVLEAS
jgi:hypothetical protein